MRGEALLDAPLSIQPYGILRGGAEGFGGELGGHSPAPTFILRRSVRRGANRRTRCCMRLPRPRNGYENSSHSSGAPNTSSGMWKAGGRNLRTIDSGTGKASNTPRPQMPYQREQNVPGGPQLTVGKRWRTSRPQRWRGDAGGMGEMMEKVDQISTLAEESELLLIYMKIIINAIMAAATFGPIGLMVYLVFKGGLRGLELGQHLPEGRCHCKGLRGRKRNAGPSFRMAHRRHRHFHGERPSLLDALFGADDAMREAVARGEHEYAPAEMRAKMCEEMLKGYTVKRPGCHHRSPSFLILKGRSRFVVSMAGGADWFISDLDGWHDECRRLFDRAGISYDKGWW